MFHFGGNVLPSCPPTHLLSLPYPKSHTCIHNLFKSDTLFHARQSWTHTRSNTSVSFQYHWQEDKQQIWWGYNSIKKEEKNSEIQPRPEIDVYYHSGFDRQIETACWIQEEIRNTHRVWSVLYLSRDDPRINNKQWRNLPIIKMPNPLPGWRWPWAECVRKCVVFMFRSFLGDFIAKKVTFISLKGVKKAKSIQSIVKSVISKWWCVCGKFVTLYPQKHQGEKTKCKNVILFRLFQWVTCSPRPCVTSLPDFSCSDG